MVVGSDILAQMTLGNLVGLGVGNICCIDDKLISDIDYPRFLYTNQQGTASLIGQYRVPSIIETLHSINPLLNYFESCDVFNPSDAKEFGPDVIINATNDSDSKRLCLEYCMGSHVPLINISSSPYLSGVSIFNPHSNKAFRMEQLLQKEFDKEKQAGHTSGIVAGLAVEQVRKLKFSIDESLDEPLNTDSFVFRLVYVNREEMDMRKLSVLIIGAGAIGNFAALNAAFLNLGKIEIIDHDVIKEDNLNRQILLYGRVGEYKASVLAERVQEVGSCAFVRYQTKKFELDSFPDNRYDLIISGIDNLKGRQEINRFAVQHRIPYLDGGSSATSGRVAEYVPGQNRCIDCSLDLKTSVKSERVAESASCVENQEPAIVIPNIIIGSALICEALNIMGNTPRLMQQVLKYDTFDLRRIYYQKPLLSSCGLSC